MTWFADTQWKWKGCKNAGAKQGDAMSRALLDGVIEGTDARAAVNLHNNQVGRQVRLLLSLSFLVCPHCFSASLALGGPGPIEKGLSHVWETHTRSTTAFTWYELPLGLALLRVLAFSASVTLLACS